VVEVVEALPEQEPVIGYKVIKEIGIGEELHSGKIFTGIRKTKDGESQLVFEETVMHEDGSTHEQSVFSYPLKLTARKFDDLPDCRFLRYELDYDSKKQRVRVLQATMSMPRSENLVPVTGITYTTDVDIPITEMIPFAPELGHAAGYRIASEHFSFGKRFLEFFWYQKSPMPGMHGRKRRIAKVVRSSAINLTHKEGEFDGKPDCIVVEYIGGPSAQIDIRAIKIGKDEYQLQEIRFLKKDK